MRNILRIGALSQPEIPEQLEALIEAIFREQFKKLSLILGQKNISLVSAYEDKANELACISAIEEGLNLEIGPLQIASNLDETDAKIRSKIYRVLENQPATTVVDQQLSKSDIISLCDILILVFDKSDLDKFSMFSLIRESFFEGQQGDPATEKLSIEINMPTLWTPDADGEVHFEYILRAPGKRDASSEIEIPERIIQQWAKRRDTRSH